MKGFDMVMFGGVIAIILGMIIWMIVERKQNVKNENEIRNKILEYLKGKEYVSIIEIIEHINIMPDKAFMVIRKMEKEDLISEKTGKFKSTKIGEKVYEWVNKKD